MMPARPKQADLLGGDGPRPPGRQYADTQALMAHYIACYQQKFGERPAVLAQDGRVLKQLAGQFGVAKVHERLDAYFAWEDPFVVDSGYSLSLFPKTWNRLTAHLQRARRADRGAPPFDCQHVPRCSTAAAHTRRYLGDLRQGS